MLRCILRTEKAEHVTTEGCFARNWKEMPTIW